MPVRGTPWPAKAAGNTSEMSFCSDSSEERARVCYQRGSRARHAGSPEFPPRDAMPGAGASHRSLPPPPSPRDAKNSRQLPADPQEPRNEISSTRWHPASPAPPEVLRRGGEFPGSPRHQGTSPPVRRRIPGRLQSRFHNLGDFGILPRRSPFPSPAGSDELTGTAPPSSDHSGEQTRGLRGLSSLIPYLVPFPIKFAAPELLPGGQKPSRSLPVEQASCFLRQYPYGMRAPSHGLSAN